MKHEELWWGLISFTIGFVVVGLFMQGCVPKPPPPAPTPPADAAPPPSVPDSAPPPIDDTDYALACANLKTLGCQEGTDPRCPWVMKYFQEAGIVDFGPQCVKSVGTINALKRCGEAWSGGCHLMGSDI
jgi:hypothetical protein